MTIEIFKTDVGDRDQANMLIDQIHKIFADYNANFDLEDCDNILRVTCTKGVIHASSLIDILKEQGCHAEVLTDNFPPMTHDYADSQVFKPAR